MRDIPSGLELQGEAIGGAISALASTPVGIEYTITSLGRLLQQPFAALSA
jgi:hypothetical protein